MVVDPSRKFLDMGNAVYSIDPVTGSLTVVSGGTGTVTMALSSTTASPTANLISLQITPGNALITSAAPGVTRQFIAVGSYDDGTTRFLTDSVSWTSSNSAIATMSSTGVATTTGFGNVTITATLGDVSATATLQVSAAPLVSIAIAPQSATIPQGRGIQFTATGVYADGSSQNLTNVVAWTSSDTTVATVSSSGLATAVGQGTTTITATLDTVSNSTTLSVQ
ncbi:MAG: Ig-like domain-containing protein [Bryobacteraceae bacterium]